MNHRKLDEVFEMIKALPVKPALIYQSSQSEEKRLREARLRFYWISKYLIYCEDLEKRRGSVNPLEEIHPLYRGWLEAVGNYNYCLLYILIEGWEVLLEASIVQGRFINDCPEYFFFDCIREDAQAHWMRIKGNRAKLTLKDVRQVLAARQNFIDEYPYPGDDSQYFDAVIFSSSSEDWAIATIGKHPDRNNERRRLYSRWLDFKDAHRALRRYMENRGNHRKDIKPCFSEEKGIFLSSIQPQQM